MRRRRTQNRRGRRALLLGGLLVLALALLASWQWPNIQAGLYYLQYSPQELEQRASQSQELLREDIDRSLDLSVQPLSPEDRDRLLRGEMTEDEAVAAMTGGSAATPPTESNREQQPVTESWSLETADPAGSALPAEEAQLAPEQEDAARRERLSQLVARVYVLRDVFKGKLEAIKNQAAAEYTALPAEKRTKTAKLKLAAACMEQAYALEGQCDSEMDAILEEMNTLLTALEEDTALVDEVKAAYAEEKAVTKAYYLGLNSH